MKLEIEYAKIRCQLSAKEWQIFSRKAAVALNKAVEHSFNAGLSCVDARDFVHSEMSRWKGCGTTDTEPNAVLETILQRFYRDDYNNSALKFSCQLSPEDWGLSKKTIDCKEAAKALNMAVEFAVNWDEFSCAEARSWIYSQVIRPGVYEAFGQGTQATLENVLRRFYRSEYI